MIDFGGEGDDVYEIDYMWLRNDHSSSFSIEYKDVNREWHVAVPWRSVEEYEFITLEEMISAAELRLLVKGSRIWDASWAMIKVYGRSDPITNFMRELRAALAAHDDLDHIRNLIKEGGKLLQQDTDEMKEAAKLRDVLHLRQECKFATERRDIKALDSLTKEAIEKMGMENDIVVLQAVECLEELIKERDFKYNHPAFKMMLKADVDEGSATKYLKWMCEAGYDCLFGLGALIVRQDDGGARALSKLRDMGIRSAIHRERIVKEMPRMKLQKQDQSSLEAFMLSINFSVKDVKKYIKALWTLKYDTMFDLLNCERFEMENLKFREGHVEAVLMISDGLHSKFAMEHDI